MGLFSLCICMPGSGGTALFFKMDLRGALVRFVDEERTSLRMFGVVYECTDAFEGDESAGSANDTFAATGLASRDVFVFMYWRGLELRPSSAGGPVVGILVQILVSRVVETVSEA